MAFPTFSEERPIPLEYFISVVELSTGEVTKITIDGHTCFQWNAAGEIVAFSSHTRSTGIPGQAR